MSIRSVEVTAREVAGLRCPFTGLPLKVFMTIQPGSVTYSAPEAFSLHVPVSGMRELLDRASTRGGVVGVAGDKPRWTDPYSGAAFRLRELPDGKVCFTGGFNPRAACGSLGEFLYKASMRNGITSMTPPKGVRVESVSAVRTPASADIKVTDEVIEAAERAVHKSGAFENPTVSMHVPKKRSK